MHQMNGWEGNIILAISITIALIVLVTIARTKHTSVEDLRLSRLSLVPHYLSLAQCIISIAYCVAVLSLDDDEANDKAFYVLQNAEIELSCIMVSGILFTLAI